MCRPTGPYAVGLTGFTLAPIDKNRVEELAEVFVSGYKGTVDYEGETKEDAERYIHKIFSNEWGEFLQAYSWAALYGTFVAGVCITLLHRELNVPFVAFLVTRNEYKR